MQLSLATHPTPQVDWLTSTPTAPTSAVLKYYRQMGNSAVGRWRFRRWMGRLMPQALALQPEFHELRVGLCRVQLRAHRRWRGPTGDLDVAALTTLSQLAASMVAAASVPPALAWSLRGLTIEHLRPTRQDVTALARLDRTEWSAGTPIALPVTLSDAAGNEVARAVITLALSNA